VRHGEAAPGDARTVPVGKKTAQEARERRRRRKLAWWFAYMHAAAADFDERVNMPDLSLEEILVWADAHHARTGQ
jgi:hypothetical protein